jgi:hypothetical protein
MSDLLSFVVSYLCLERPEPDPTRVTKIFSGVGYRIGGITARVVALSAR